MRATPFLKRGNSGCLYDFITNHTLFCFSVINKTGQSKMVSSNKWLFQLNIFPYNPQSGIKMSKMALKDESNVAESCSMHHMSNYNCLDMLKFHTEWPWWVRYKTTLRQKKKKKREAISRFYTPKEIWKVVLFPFFPLKIFPLVSFISK